MQNIQMLQNHTNQRNNCVNFLLFKRKNRNTRNITKHKSNYGTGFNLINNFTYIKLRTTHTKHNQTITTHNLILYHLSPI